MSSLLIAERESKKSEVGREKRRKRGGAWKRRLVHRCFLLERSASMSAGKRSVGAVGVWLRWSTAHLTLVTYV